jgi:phage baseplate assembly protein W
MASTTLTRASYQTGQSLIGPIYNDILLSFAKNPVTGSLGMVYNEISCAQMLMALIMTETGSWPFEYNNGSKVSHSLFQPNDTIQNSILSSTIQEAIAQYAPMVVLVSLQINPSPANPDYALTVSIYYQIQNVPGTFLVKVPIMRRIR